MPSCVRQSFARFHHAPRLATRIASLAFASALIACGGGGGDTPAGPQPVAIATLSFATSSLALNGVGADVSVDVTASPSNATGTVTFSTGNPSIATVTSSGRTATIHAVAGGTTQLTATAGNVQTSATITVIPISRAVTITAPTGGTQLTVGQSITVTANATGDAGATSTLAWSSSADAIATISQAGLLTAIAPGAVTITATSTNNAAAKATLAFTIVAVPQVQSVTISPTKDTVLVGADRDFTATVTADASLAKTVTWRSSTPAVATVSNAGKATSLTVGTTTITAVSTADTTKRASAELIVRGLRVTAITIASVSSLGVGENSPATATVTGDAAANKSVTWSVTPAGIAGINASGTVFGVAPGTATIKATSVLNPEISGTRAITITPAAGALTWRTAGLDLPGGSVTTQRLRVWSVNQNLTFALGDSGTLFKVTPTGTTKIGESSVARVDMSADGLRGAISGSSATDVVMAGPGGRIVRYDGTQLNTLLTGGSDFIAVSAYAANGPAPAGAVAVGMNGRIVRIRNGVATTENSGTGLNLRAVHALNDNLAVAAGNTSGSGTPTVFVNAGGGWGALPVVNAGGRVGGIAVRTINDIDVSLVSADLDRFASLYHWNGAAWSRVLPLAALPTELTACPNSDILMGSDGAVVRRHDATFTLLGAGDWDIHPELNTYSCDAEGNVRSGGSYGFVARLTAGATTVESWTPPLGKVSVVSSTRAFATGIFGSLWSFDGTKWTMITPTIDTRNLASPLSADATDVWYTDYNASFGCGSYTVKHRRANGTVETITGQTNAPTAIYGSGPTFAVVASVPSAACVGNTVHTSHFLNGVRTDVAVPANAPNATTLSLGGIGTSTLFLAESSGGSTQLRKFVGNAWQAIGGRRLLETRAMWVSSENLVYFVGNEGRIVEYDGINTFFVLTGLPELDATTLVGVWGTGPSDVHVCGASGVVAAYNGIAWNIETPANAQAPAINACHGAQGLAVGVGDRATVRLGTRASQSAVVRRR